MPALDLIIGNSLPLHDSSGSSAVTRNRPKLDASGTADELNGGNKSRGGAGVPEWIGTVLFLSAVGLSGTKIAVDFGNRGIRGYAMLLLLILIYASAIAVAYS